MPKETPLVSVIIPTYNRPHLLSEALKSVLNQTFSNFEAIIINDAGEDVQELVNSFRDDRIIYLKHSKNRGLPATRNSGIRIARGKYIAYLDDDDIYYPQHLEILLLGLQNSTFKFAYSDTDFLYKRIENGQLITYAKKPHISPPYSPEEIVIENQLCYLCVVHEKACFEAVGLFDESLNWAEDWDMWIRLSAKYPFLHIPIATTGYSYVIDGNTKMTQAWIGKFLNVLLILHARYKEQMLTKAQINHALNVRKDIFAKAYKELEEMDDQKLHEAQPDIVMQNIMQNALQNSMEDVKAARFLSNYLLQRIPDNNILWRIYAILCRHLGDLKSASIAITRAIEYKESEENIQEYLHIHRNLS